MALTLGCGDGAAVRHLLTSPDLARDPATPVDAGPLARYDRPPPSVAEYDQLLASRATPTAVPAGASRRAASR